MNEAFFDLLDYYIIVYLEDILMYILRCWTKYCSCLLGIGPPLKTLTLSQAWEMSVLTQIE